MKYPVLNLLCPSLVPELCPDVTASPSGNQMCIRDSSGDVLAPVQALPGPDLP